jgi:hypothetical protein
MAEGGPDKESGERRRRRGGTRRASAETWRTVNRGADDGDPAGVGRDGAGERRAAEPRSTAAGTLRTVNGDGDEVAAEDGGYAAGVG